MTTSVAVPIIDGLAMFEFGAICEAFGGRRNDPLVPEFDFRVCGIVAGESLTSGVGMEIVAPYDLSAFDDADLIAVPAVSMRKGYPPELLEALRAAAARGATILSICSGAFILSAAGLLDGRRCTTHWKYVDELRAASPSAQVEEDVLYVEDGNIVTSAGTAAGVDACLHLVRKEWGATAANTLARYMVVAPHREGDQRQYIERPVPHASEDGTARVLEYMASDLTRSYSVEELADLAHLSPRSFSRRFLAATGTTPMRWLKAQRLQECMLLLETTSLNVESISRACGYGTSAGLRKQFRSDLGMSPSEYRRRHQSSAQLQRTGTGQ